MGPLGGDPDPTRCPSQRFGGDEREGFRLCHSTAASDMFRRKEPRSETRPIRRATVRRPRAATLASVKTEQ